MTEPTRIVAVIALTCTGVLADTMLKLGSTQRHPIWNGWSAAGFALTACFALLWLFLTRTMNLGTLGVVYAVGSALLLVATGVVVFGERLTGAEVAGVALAVTSLPLLGRVAG